MWKKILATLLALSMLLALAACGSGDSGGSDSGASYDIGYNTWGSGSAVFDIMNNIVVQALGVYGSGGTRAIDNNQADTELDNINNFVSAGVDGIVMQACATTILPQAAAACEDAEIPFVLSIFPGDDDDRADLSENNVYYLGSVSADMYAEGYLIGKMAAEDGMTTAVLVGGNVGDTLFEERIEGFTQAFVTEGGGEILDSARCTSPAECQEKASALLSAYSDTDMIYAMVGDYSVGCISAMETLGLDIPVYVTNADTNCIEYIRDGTIAGATSGNELVGAVAVALLINYLDGNQILDDEGNPPELVMTGFEVNADNVDDFETIFGDDDGPYTAERLQTLLARYNSDVSYDTFVDFIENQLTLEVLIADRS
ncbi:MAG: sugar ABC transporter substrate-binding protein [Oscillospiraceae bacterium]|nr:sugar ABC transporter substrate-binding protein [Oscillospiraceae bacterium]